MPSPLPCSSVICECLLNKTQIEKKNVKHIHNTLKVTCKKFKMGSFTFSIMKNVVMLPAWSRFPVKLISCFGFGSASSPGCLLKVCVCYILLAYCV